MNLNEYQQFVKENKLPSILNLPRNVQLLYSTAEINGEAGEVTEKVKKIFRDQNGEVTEENRTMLKKELGDILWGITSTADVLGLQIQDILDLNVEKCRERLKTGTISGSGDEREISEVPVFDEEEGVLYYRKHKIVGFGGIGTTNQQVLKSGAGFYIGTLYQHESLEWFPYSRDSEEYWNTRLEAETALITRKYTPKI